MHLETLQIFVKRVVIFRHIFPHFNKFTIFVIIANILIVYEEICQILYLFYMSNQRHFNLQLLICFYQTHLASGEVRDHMNLINERIKHERLRVCVFPEGTRNKAFDGKMLPFKKGNVFI